MLRECKLVGELNVIDTTNLQRVEVLEWPGKQRLAQPEGLDIVQKAKNQSNLLPATVLPGKVIWRGWASDLITALDAAA